MKSSKKMLWVLGCIGVAALCLCLFSGGLVFRYIAGGVNPLREMRMAAFGESIEIKDQPSGDGKLNRQLLIDSIDHGGQFEVMPKRPGQPDWSRVPTTYYHTRGPVGVTLGKFNWFRSADHAWQAADARMPISLIGAGGTGFAAWSMLASAWSEPPIGVIMMNNGTLAAYARPYQWVDVYERNPKIVQLSMAPAPQAPRFTHVSDAQKRGAHLRVLEGNERATFAKQAPQQFYHLLILDTSRGHPGLPSKELLTKEAWQSYMNAIVESGVVCVHTSSRDFKLSEVVASTTADLGLAHLNLHDGISDRDIGHYTSEWVVVARKAPYLDYIRQEGIIRAQVQRKMPHERFTVAPLPANSDLVWTDGGANSLANVRR